MSYTKIIAVKSRLKACLKYTSNPEKTFTVADVKALGQLLDYAQRDSKTGQYRFVTGFHCTPETALQTMQNTKHRWHKDTPGYVQGYHIIQSFAPGEITPERCFQIGCEFAERYLADKYECTVSTHLDKGHLHCHIVFNSVSYTDGRMFRNDFAAYYQGIRKVSDELCKAHGLSVIETDGSGTQYHAWKTEKEGGITIRKTVQADLDAAMKCTASWDAFVSELRRRGYVVQLSGPHRKYTTVQPAFGKRAIRLSSLEEPYHENAIKQYFAKRQYQRLGAEEPGANRSMAEETQQYYTLYQKQLPAYIRRKYTGFMAMYYHYRLLLRHVRRGKTSRRYTHLLWEDLQKFERIKKQCDFIWENRIGTLEDVAAIKNKAGRQITQLVAERKQLYYLRGKNQSGYNSGAIAAQIEDLTKKMQELRKLQTLCRQIEVDAVRIEQQWEQIRCMETGEQGRKEKEQNEQRSRRR